MAANELDAPSAAPMRRLAIAWTLCFVMASGCGDSVPYQLAPVAGVVMLDGKVVPYTQIVFQPKGSADNASPGPGSTAFCDAAGKFELATVRGEPGAVVGVHAVQIYAHGPPKSTAGDSDAGPPAKQLFPAHFNVNTQLTFDVPVDGTDTANFELKSNQ